MKGKRLSKLVGAICLAALIAIPFAAGCAAPTPAPAPAPEKPEVIKARLTTKWGPTHQSCLFVKDFVDAVTEATNGRLQIEIFPAGQLYGHSEALPAISGGAVEMGGVPGSMFAAYFPEFQVGYFPFLFNSYDQLDELYTKNEAGRAIREKFEQQLGVKVIANTPLGPRALTAVGKPVLTVEDWRGRKGRSGFVGDHPVWDSLGASCIIVQTGELHTALQTGMVDLFQTSPTALRSFGWYELAKYIHKPFLTFGEGYIVVNAEWLNSLPTDIKDILVNKVGPKISEESTGAIMEIIEKTVDQLCKEEGVTLITFEPSEIARMKQIMVDKAYPKMIEEMDPAFWNAVLELTK